MKNIVRLMTVLLFCSMINSCSTFQNITVFGEPGIEIYTPNLEKVGIIKGDGKGEITLPRDGYYPFLLSSNGGADIKIPFALDYKNRSYTGARVLYCVEAAIAGAGAASFIITTTACIVSGEDGESLGIAPLMGAGGVGTLGGSLCGLVTTNRLAETQREWQFEYLSRQSTNQDLRFEKFVDNGYRKEIGGKAVSVEENVAESSRKVESAQSESSSSAAKSRSSKSKRTLTDLAKQVEGTYIGSGKLLRKDETIENYQDIKIVLKRLDKNAVQVDVYESNGEAYFNESGKYSVKKIDSGKYQLTMNGIPSATITIDANKKMVYLHPKVNIDGDLYTLRISAGKETRTVNGHKISMESMRVGIVGREVVKSEQVYSNTIKDAYAVIEYDREYDDVEFIITDKNGKFAGQVYKLIEDADPYDDPEIALFCWKDVTFTFSDGTRVTERCRLQSNDKNSFSIESLAFSGNMTDTSDAIKDALLSSDIKKITIGGQSIGFSEFKSSATIREMRTYKM